MSIDGDRNSRSDSPALRHPEIPTVPVVPKLVPRQSKKIARCMQNSLSGVGNYTIRTFSTVTLHQWAPKDFLADADARKGLMDSFAKSSTENRFRTHHAFRYQFRS